MLQVRFAQVGHNEGYRNDGSVALAKFEIGESDERTPEGEGAASARGLRRR